MSKRISFFNRLSYKEMMKMCKKILYRTNGILIIDYVVVNVCIFFATYLK